MVPQTAVTSVGFSTLCASAHPEVCVCYSVAFQAAQSVKPFLTLIARVSLVTCMATFMLKQTLVRIKSLLASFTFVGSAVKVPGISVVSKISECRKGMSTQLTGKRLFFGMSSGMYGKFTWGKKTFPTQTALKIVVRMFASHMLLICTLTVQNMITNWTRFWSAEVQVEVFLQLETSPTVRTLMRRLCLVLSVYMTR